MTEPAASPILDDESTPDQATPPSAIEENLQRQHDTTSDHAAGSIASTEDQDADTTYREVDGAQQDVSAANASDDSSDQAVQRVAEASTFSERREEDAAGVHPDEEEEDEEAEPRLKYQRLGGDVGELLAKDAGCCLAVSDKMLALGTQGGGVHLLDYSGNEVKRCERHAAAVNDLCFDQEAEYIASCSEAGTVVVTGLYTEDTVKFKQKKLVKTVALDPRYGSRKTRDVLSGGAAGQLLLTSRGWLGSRDTVLHEGEGTIHVARWAGNLVVWANEKAVRVYDMAMHQHVSKFDRPADSLADSTLKCHIFWEGEGRFYMGWGKSIKVARVHTTLASGTGSGEIQRRVTVLASFQTDYLIMGVSPFGNDLAVLALASAPNNTGTDMHGPSNGHGSHTPAAPELKIMTRENEELASDALCVTSSDRYEGRDYTLAAFYPMESRTASTLTRSGSKAEFSKWWADGYEPLYYIISPKDIIVGRPRDGDDRVAWLLEHQLFEKALHIAETDKTLKAASHEQVAQSYLDHLLSHGNFEEAASLCPRLLKGNAAAWERQVYTFAQLRAVQVLAPYIPTQAPRLRRTAYEVVLDVFLLHPKYHAQLLDTLRKWPSDVYSLPALTDATMQRIRGLGGKAGPLLQVAAHLYSLQGRHDLALAILLRLRQPDVFDYVLRHALVHALTDHVTELLDINEARAVDLLVDHHSEIPPSAVVPCIQAAIAQAEAAGDAAAVETGRRRLHRYLDGMFKKDSTAAADYHILQVELYAEYDPERLMGFLMASQAYPLEAAYEVAAARGLTRELVFILGRMGNAAQALHLIVGQLRDIPQAIAFVQGQHDEELWELLISLALASPDTTGALLDNIGGYLNPLRLVQQIPAGMDIPRLRDRLVHIIADFRTQTSLRQGCNTILRHDCLVLAQRLYQQVRHALRELYVKEAPAGGAGPGRWSVYVRQSRHPSTSEARDLPGPHGGKSLHIKPKGPGATDADPADAVLPKVWVGLNAPPNLEGDAALAVARPQRRPRRSLKQGDMAPSLPSLV